GGKNSKTYLIFHETDNTNKGANADAHGRLQANGNSRQASWQYTVDDKEIVQSFSDNAQCWAAGNAHYNKHGINIEICVNSDGNYKKAVDLAVELGKYLMKKYNIPLKNVIRHHDTSGKNCPRHLMAGTKGITWNEFKGKLSGVQSPSTNTSVSKRKQTKPSNNKPNMTSDSIDAYLASIGETSTYAHRTKLARQYGINGYKGTATQNTKLLNLLRSGSKPKKNNSSGTSSKVALKVGGKVKIKTSAGNYSRTTTAIPSKHKNKSYTIQQVAKNDVLIKELYSWVKKSDLVGGSTTNKKATSTKKYTPNSYKVGSKVKIKSSAKTYSRSTAAIPARYKNKTHTIQQVGKDDVLIKELYSWVNKNDTY